MVETRTIEQVVLVLAPEEVPCLCGGALGTDEAHWEAGLQANCHNTGQVARFPMLREACRGWPVYPDLVEYGRSYCTTNENCRCQGRGWLPNCTTDALLEAIDSTVTLAKSSKGWKALVDKEHLVKDWSPTWQMALALALEATHK